MKRLIVRINSEVSIKQLNWIDKYVSSITKDDNIRQVVIKNHPHSQVLLIEVYYYEGDAYLYYLDKTGRAMKGRLDNEIHTEGFE